MSAATALKLANASDVSVRVDGNDLVLEAAFAPPSEVIDLLSRYKAEVIALLRSDGHRWPAEEWEAFFHERAGIAEYDGGMPRREAEALAFEHCAVEWLMHHPVRSKPGCCLGCGNAENERGVVLPFGTETNGHVWLHSDCWPAWYAARRKEAVTALAVLGIISWDRHV